jgi:hypothetical protein
MGMMKKDDEYSIFNSTWYAIYIFYLVAKRAQFSNLKVFPPILYNLYSLHGGNETSDELKS